MSIMKPSSSNGDMTFVSGNKRKRSDGAVVSHQDWANTPAFLAKTYEMISECDPNVATWSEAGDTFVVRSKMRLATEFIPLYFHHQNYRSFERQLNFYGFRKVQTKLDRKSTGKISETSVEYQHKNFQRDSPQSIKKIRRSTNTHNNKAQTQEVEELQAKVFHLEDLVKKISSEMESKVSFLSTQFETHLKCMAEIMDACGGEEERATPLPFLRLTPSEEQVLLSSLEPMRCIGGKFDNHTGGVTTTSGGKIDNHTCGGVTTSRVPVSTTSALLEDHELFPRRVTLCEAEWESPTKCGDQQSAEGVQGHALLEELFTSDLIELGNIA